MTASLPIFIRQIRSRSSEHQQAMKLLAEARLYGQMIAVLRQELDSMVRVIYLLTQTLDRREALIEAAVHGGMWTRENSSARITDKEMVDIAHRLQGWTRSVYKFGCAFIHLSSLHDYNDRDPLLQLPPDERRDVIEHCRVYHGGPADGADSFKEFVPYIPKVLEKISGNLECYLENLEKCEVMKIEEI